MTDHKVVTTHIRSMLEDALKHAEAAESGDLALVHLDRAAVLARHAAAELDDERSLVRYTDNVDKF